MSSVKMVALRKHPFGTGEREEGEEYEATADEAAILTALKWAKKAPQRETEVSVAAEPAPTPEPTAEVAKVEKVQVSDAGGKKRAYQRRDMKAKD
jgi:hypothetical protein